MLLGFQKNGLRAHIIGSPFFYYFLLLYISSVGDFPHLLYPFTVLHQTITFSQVNLYQNSTKAKSQPLENWDGHFID